MPNTKPSSGALTHVSRMATGVVEVPSEKNRLRPDRAAKPLTLFFKFLTKASVEEIKKLPGGSFLAAGFETLAELSDSEQEGDKDDQIESILATTEATHEQVKRLSDLAAAIFINSVAIAETIGKSSDINSQQLSEAAKESALITYKLKVIRDCRDIDRMGIGQSDLLEHIALLPLDDVYVIPNLTISNDIYGERQNEQQILRQLDEEGEYLTESERKRLESEQAELRTQPWKRGLSAESSKPVGASLKIESQVVVLGLPGTGKSTLINFLARVTAIGSEIMLAKMGWVADLTPIMVSLAAYANSRKASPDFSLKEYVLREMGAKGNTVLCSVIAEELQENRVFLLLDGLDEVPDEIEREDVVREIEKFLEEHSQTRCLITSRPAGYIPIRHQLTTFHLPNFTPQQVEQFLYGWRRALARYAKHSDPDYRSAEQAAATMLQEIHENSQIKDLLLTP